MMDQITRAFDAIVSDMNRKERSIVATVNTGHIDRFNSVIAPEGAKLDGYNRGAKLLLWSHGKDPRRHDDPIGNALWLKPVKGSDGAELRGKFRFLEDDFSSQRYEWYRDGVLNGFSIRPLPDWTRCGPATKDEIRANPELGRGVYSENGKSFPGVMMFRSWELAEVSATPLVGNVHCTSVERAVQLLHCVDDGLWLPDEDLAVLRGLSAAVTAPAAEPDASTPAVMRSDPHVAQVDGAWRVNVAGRIAASYDSEPPAVRCLAALTGEAGPRVQDRIYADVMAVRSWSDQQTARALEEITLRLTGHCGSSV
jgi:hypothetical protein